MRQIMMEITILFEKYRTQLQRASVVSGAIMSLIRPTATGRCVRTKASSSLDAAPSNSFEILCLPDTRLLMAEEKTSISPTVTLFLSIVQTHEHNRTRYTCFGGLGAAPTTLQDE